MKFLTMMMIGITLLLSSIDMNNATKKELMTLNGVGQKKADAIT